MQITAMDQLVCIADGDSYASAMGAQYPDNAGNAQYYDLDASGNIIQVTPTFADQDGKRLKPRWSSLRNRLRLYGIRFARTARF